MHDMSGRRRTRLIEGNEKSHHLINNQEKDFAASVYLSMRMGMSKCKSDATSTCIETANRSGLELAVLALKEKDFTTGW
jgi:hypothetical protein